MRVLTSKHFLELPGGLERPVSCCCLVHIKRVRRGGGVGQMGGFLSRSPQLPLHSCTVRPKGIPLGAESDRPVESICSGELSACPHHAHVPLHVQEGEKTLLLFLAFPNWMRTLTV